VLRLITMVTRAAQGTGKWVGVCGEVAGEEVATPILIGLGVRELSVNPKQVPLIKAAVRRWSLSDARRLADQALSLDNGHAVRELVEAAITPA
jgi:phosphoenolpyruvate-protein kinase (PTS system EI component)